ncbi:hypothetical protein NDU88_005246 [Pleurodeles waltl]|uniref:Uncharacterized protein n=1 Tax=Pleurodeles waltl TaxID=8319 RepID=A0AAV7RLJ8_PLEWA|nr:hypothetical protein NDU88_005246 [Pleurodeles waltl]
MLKSDTLETKVEAIGFLRSSVRRRELIGCPSQPEQKRMLDSPMSYARFRRD